MALDTRERRASIISLSSCAPPSPLPNVVKDQEWRQCAGWAYAGILVGAPVPPAPPAPPTPPTPPTISIVAGEALAAVPFAGQEEILEWWRSYFRDVGMSESRAIVMAEEMISVNMQDEQDLIDLAVM